MHTLDLCEGPACPRCGCTDTDILRRPAEPADVNPDGLGTWFTDGRARCRNCNTEFCFRELPRVDHRDPPPLARR